MGPYQQAVWLCCHAAAETNMHILWAKAASNMQLCCHAAVELNKHAYIMGQGSKQCTYVAMQLWNLTNSIYYEPKW